MKPILRAALVLSGLIAVLAAFASAAGLLFPGLYRDNTLVASTWPGNDFVTLVGAVPVLVASMVLAALGSARAHLVWVGMLDYMLYNYGFYLFGSAFNLLFLCYAALFGMSIWAIVLALVGLDVRALASRFSPRTPTRWIAGYMFFVGLGLATVYVLQWVGFAVSGETPELVQLAEHPTNIVFAQDLSLVIPVLVVGGVWLWQRRPWGYVLSAVANVKGAAYMLALCAASLTAVWAGAVESTSELGIWGAIGIGSLAAATAVLWNLRPQGRAPSDATAQPEHPGRLGAQRVRPG